MTVTYAQNGPSQAALNCSTEPSSRGSCKVNCTLVFEAIRKLSTNNSRRLPMFNVSTPELLDAKSMEQREARIKHVFHRKLSPLRAESLKTVFGIRFEDSETSNSASSTL